MAAIKVTPSTGDAREIQRLLGTAKQVGRPDHYQGKREHTRFSAGMKLEITTDPMISSASYHVVMQNLSGGGFAFWSKRELRPHSPIFVREFSNDNENDWVAAEVRHCTTGLRGYLVGAEFEHATPDDPPASPRRR
jgi:hypothetical protein